MSAPTYHPHVAPRRTGHVAAVLIIMAVVLAVYVAGAVRAAVAEMDGIGQQMTTQSADTYKQED